MTAAAGTESGTPGRFTVVGTRHVRHDGLDKVAGRTTGVRMTRLPMTPAAILVAMSDGKSER